MTKTFNAEKIFLAPGKRSKRLALDCESVSANLVLVRYKACGDVMSFAFAPSPLG